MTFLRRANLISNLLIIKRPPCLIELFSRTQSTLSQEKTQLVRRLVSIFTTPPFAPDPHEELNNFGSKLTTDVVESSLKEFKEWKTALRMFYWASTQTGYKHSCYTYNAMASILSAARQNAPLKDLARDMITSRCYMSPGALGFIVRCLGGVGMVEEAGILFDQVKQMGLCSPNGYSYNALLEGISKLGSVGLLEKRLIEMRAEGWEPDKYTLTPVLRCCCNAGDFDKALGVFYEMNGRGWVDSHVFVMLLLSFSKWGKVDSAFDLIERMEDFKINLNEKTFYCLIHGFARENRVDKALQLFDKMLSFRFVPDISLYSVLIEGLCKNKENEKAFRLISQMNKWNLLPDVKILTVLISSLSDEREGISLFKEMRKTLVNNKSVIAVYNSTLSDLVKNGLIDKAYFLLRAMMKNENAGSPEVDDHIRVEEIGFPDSTSFSIVIDGLCQKGKLDMALGLYKYMDQISCQRSLLLYNNLINALSNANRVDECHELLAEMKELGVIPSQFTYNSILGCLSRRGDLVASLHMLREMRACGHEPWIKNYTLLVKKLCSNQRAIAACEFLAKMVQVGFIPNIIAYTAAIDGLLKMQEVDRALKLFREICARGQCPDVVSYNTIIAGLCKAKRLLESQDVFNEMVEKGLVPSVPTYNLLIDACCKSDNIDQANGWLSRMKREQREPNIFTYTTLINGLCSAGRAEEAVLLWNELVVKEQEKGCSPNGIAFMALIHGLCKCRMPDAALIYFLDMEKKQMTPDSYVYVALIQAFICDSNAPLALDVLKKMIRHEKFPDLPDKNFITTRDAVVRLLNDARTSSDMRNLIAEGNIPTVLNISDTAE